MSKWKPKCGNPKCRGWVHDASGAIQACDDCGRFRTRDGISNDDGAKRAHAHECGCSWSGK